MSADEDDLSILLSSATLVIVGQILYSVSKLVERIVIARFLTPDAYGEVNIGLALMTLAVTIGLIGFRQGVPRYMSRLDDQRDKRGVWVTGLAIAGTIGIALGGLFLFNVGPVAGVFFEDPQNERLLALFVVSVPFVIGMQVGIGAIRGLENTRYRTYTRDLLYPGLRLLVIIGMLTTGAGIMAAGYAYLIAALVSFVVAHALLNRLLPLVGPVRTHAREMLAFSIPLVVSNLLSRLLTRTDTLMLGYFRPSYEVGLYSAAFPLATALGLILSSFGFMYLPVASRLDAENKRDEVDAIYTLTTKWIYVLTFPLFLTLVAFPSDVLSITFGSEYAPASTALSILAVGFFVRAGFGRCRETVSALGYTTYLLATTVGGFTLNVALNLLLIPTYGYPGAAVASAVTFVALNIVVYAFLELKFGISPFTRRSIRTFCVLPLTLFPPTLLVARHVSLTIVTLPVFLGATSLATVAVVSVTGCLQPEDRIPVQFLEDRLGVQIPIIRLFLPDGDDTTPTG